MVEESNAEGRYSWLYPSVKEACEALLQAGNRIEPTKESAKRYNRKHATFTHLYAAIKETFSD
ncbi:MAG: hypothetical protein PUJ43_02355 [Bacillales bacterium]|nr:hypothetical protein [Bacillales bacterium]MDY5920454.1 hypothetical protein [Candidatus Enteromonas sp.]